MDTIRSFSPPSHSATLGEALISLFTGLYKAWYILPRKSTCRHVDFWCKTHAKQMAKGEISNDEIANFLSELAQMTGVHEAVPEELTEAKDAVGKPNASITQNDAQSLASFMKTVDPVGYVVQQMVFVPERREELFHKVREALEAVASQLPPDVQRQLSSIWSGAAPPYEDALRELETIPAVLRLTHKLFLSNKQDAALKNTWGRQTTHEEGDVYRGFTPPSVERGTSRLGDVKSMRSGEVAEAWPAKGEFEGLSAAKGMGSPRGIAKPASAQDDNDQGHFESVEYNDDVANSDDINIDDRIRASARQFYTDVRFPSEIRPKVETPLVVQLTTGQSQESRVQGGQLIVDFPTLDEKESPASEYVEVVLSAPGMKERTDVWNRTILVHPNSDSQPAIFLLSAEGVGDCRMNIAFYHDDRQLGQVEIETSAVQFLTNTEPSLTESQAAAIAAPVPSMSRPADLELRVTRGNGENQLAFMLHSSKSQVGYHWRPVGEITLVQTNPQEYLEGKFERMSQFAGMLTAGSSDDEKRKAMREIETIGEEIFEDLFPEALKYEFWQRIKPLREKGEIQSLLITSDEPWIPWEMVKPYRYNEVADTEDADGFLCQTFQFCRWLAGCPPREGVEIRRVKTVIPELDLVFAQRERDYFESLEDASLVDVSEPLKNREQVLDSTRDGGFELLHFALHGLFDPEKVNRSPLILEGGDELYPEDLVGSQLRGLRRSKPIVFLNACHTARINFALTGLGGWADKMVNDAGVTAFVGTLWEVNDELALAFATKFYDELRNGCRLGEAFGNARTHIREMSPANPTWLAYTLYGDPNSQVTWR